MILGNKQSLSKLGAKNPMWAGGVVGYKALHAWLNRNFGKANKCENKGCPKTSKSYEWALKKGRRYSRNREDYTELCKRCHNHQDIQYALRRRNKLGRFIKTWKKQQR